jgi:alkylation response protein AidB-like acyl-CoA dehydrogenase
MSTVKEQAKTNEPLKGGEFLIKESDKNIFTPEDWSEEDLMIKDTCVQFLEQEVIPNLDKIDSMEPGLMQELLDKAGELGLLGVSNPEEFGGFGKGFNTSMLVAEATGAGHAFSVAISAHTGIGTLPILYYGNDKKKKKYIPKLTTGEWKASYCLTEPDSGSDANSGKTKAVLSKDKKKYILNGQKMWITNGGFADVYTVFAKIDDDENLSAFIVERGYKGLSLNAEEKKMGIKGSSTVQVFLEDCEVPVTNLLGKRGEGFKIALNILNIGRIKLAAATLGSSKKVITHSVNYANERNQFGRPISKYGAIRHKLAEQVIKTFVLESGTYRTSNMIEELINSKIESGMSKEEATLKGIEEYAVECAILKVAGSECLDYVTDEAVQIYGGMGFSAESPVERAYRDSRINRIFEGTNEINRMLIVDMMLKRAMKGRLDLMGPAQAVAGELMSIPDFEDKTGELFEDEKKYIANFKKTALMIAGSAVQKFMMSLAKEQEILMNISDILIDTYMAESAMLRVMKMVEEKGIEESMVYVDIVKTYINSIASRVNTNGREALNGFAEGDELRMMLMGVKRFTKTEMYNTKESRRRIAQKLIDDNEYKF